MSSVKKYLAIGIAVLLLILLFVGFLALSEPYIKGSSKNALFNQSNQSDIIVSVSESFINSVLQAELELRQPKGVKNVTIFLNEGGPVEVLVELQVSLGITTVEPKVKVEANLSAENNTIKVEPESLDVGKLNMPRIIWIGPLNAALETVGNAVNEVVVTQLQKGFKITGVYVGEHYLTLTIEAPPPEELKQTLRKG